VAIVNEPGCDVEPLSFTGWQWLVFRVGLMFGTRHRCGGEWRFLDTYAYGHRSRCSHCHMIIYETDY